MGLMLGPGKPDVPDAGPCISMLGLGLNRSMLNPNHIIAKTLKVVPIAAMSDARH